jgi:hypothetical protein
MKKKPSRVSHAYKMWFSCRPGENPERRRIIDTGPEYDHICYIKRFIGGTDEPRE